MTYLENKKKKERNKKRLGKIVSVFVVVVFLSSVFVVFVQDNDYVEQGTFNMVIQIKDYTNPIQGDVKFEGNMTLTEIFSMYGMLMNETCISTDNMYCNDEEYSWKMFLNDEIVVFDPNYEPLNNDQIIFKYENQ